MKDSGRSGYIVTNAVSDNVHLVMGDPRSTGGEWGHGDCRPRADGGRDRGTAVLARCHMGRPEESSGPSGHDRPAALFNEVLHNLPWWNRDWKVDRVQPGSPAETGDHRSDPAVRVTEVSIPGTVASANSERLPFVAKVGFTGDRLIRFQAKIGDVVIGPAVAPAGRSEPHPFGRVLTGLMDLRGIPVREMARAVGLSMSTIHMLRRGHNPNLLQTCLIAGILDMSEADVKVIAGLDDGSTQ